MTDKLETAQPAGYCSLDRDGHYRPHKEVMACIDWFAATDGGRRGDQPQEPKQRFYKILTNGKS